jgi:hypothetical protein
VWGCDRGHTGACWVVRPAGSGARRERAGGAVAVQVTGVVGRRSL